MAAAWPEIDERAVLTLACCGEQLSTRIETQDGNQCVVHLPVHTCAETTLAAEDNVLSWFSPDHCWTRPVEIVGHGGYPRTALWVLEAKGHSERWQRRDYVRVTTRIPITAYSGDTKLYEMEAIDISEGGIRCAVTADQLVTLPPMFNVRFDVDGVETRVETRVAWTTTHPEQPEFEALAGLEFQGITTSTSDVIRNYVFRLQIALRRKRLIDH